jgi:hypothetical protein
VLECLIAGGGQLGRLPVARVADRIGEVTKLIVAQAGEAGRASGIQLSREHLQSILGHVCLLRSALLSGAMWEK